MLLAMIGRLPWFRPRASATPTEEERKCWYQWEGAAVLVFLLSSALSGWGLYVLLEGLHTLLHPSLSPRDWVLRPAMPLVLVLVFFSMVPGALVTHCFLRLAMGRTLFNRYLACWETAYGARYGPSLLLLIAIILLPCLPVLGALMNAWMRVGTDRIDYNPLLQVTTCSYGYDEVTDVTRHDSFRAPIGTIVRKPCYVITFRDGATFSTHSSPLSPLSQDDARQLAELIAYRAGKTITVVDPYP